MRKVIIFLLAVTCLLSGCKQKTSSSIEIGAIIPLTGFSASNGVMFQQGIQLAVDEINAENGEVTFNVQYEDSKSSAKDANFAYRKLSSSGIKYYAGLGGQFILGFAPETKDSDKILFATAAPNSNLLTLTNRCFRLFPTIEMVTDKIRDYIVKNDYKKIAIVYMQIEAYSMYNESIQRKLAEVGREVVFVESYEPNTRDFKNIVNKLSAQNPDFVYAAGAGESAALFTKQLFNNPKTSHLPVIGDMNFSHPENLAIIGELKAPVSVVDNYMSPEFVSHYKEVYNQTPTAYSVYGYIIPYLLKSAFDALGIEASSTEVYDYIHNNVSTTAAGSISFDAVSSEPNLDLIVNTQSSNE